MIVQPHVVLAMPMPLSVSDEMQPASFDIQHDVTNVCAERHQTRAE